MARRSTEPDPATPCDGGEAARSEADRNDEPTLGYGEPGAPVGPDFVGPYRLIRRLGEGGMGEVWLAEQDEPVRRRVALKVIKRGMDTRQVIARFQAERQALALMDHPAIARVLDAGQTHLGRPFFVMEYVRGVPITDYCARHRLGLRRRLLLFRQVCEGVQHAHQKAVIHRDLKPSNILVTEHQERAMPKIIDFGVAKATAQRLTDDNLYTELGQMIGTPEFMSPEQADLTGEDVDTRADVYSLGAVLYTLLAGAQPFDSASLRKEGPEALRRKIRDEDPPRPSVRVKGLGDAAPLGDGGGEEPATLARHLAGDLDWIVMKAMAKDRNRRYSSPQAMAADLGRYLDNEPVEARPPSTPYRMLKFTRRHRAGVSLAAAVFLFLVIFAVGMTLQTRRVTQERDQKEAALAEAEAVTTFLTDMMAAVDPLREGNDATVREVLDAASVELATAFDSRPTVEARVRLAIGKGYTALGQYDRAEQTLDTAYVLRRSLLGPDHLETLETMAELARVYYEQGRLDDAEAFYRRVLDGRRRELGADSRRTRWAQNSLALTHLARGDFAEAEALFSEALASDRRDGAVADDLTLALMTNLAAAYHFQGRYTEAEPLYRESLQIQQRNLGERHPDTLMTRGNLGELLADRGEAERAEALLVEVLAAKRSVFGDDQSSTLYTLGVLADLYRAQGRPGKAEPLLVEALDDRLRRLGPQHRETLLSRVELARLYAEQRRPGAALEQLAAAVEGGYPAAELAADTALVPLRDEPGFAAVAGVGDGGLNGQQKGRGQNGRGQNGRGQ